MEAVGTAVAAYGSRFQPPRLLHEQLSRPHLLEQLLEVRGSISLLLGPPSGGRTVLMSESYQRLQEQGEEVCWVNLAYADNDPATLRQHLAQAFGVELEVHGGLGAVPAAINSFIDGAQWLENPRALDTLQNFVLSLPPSSRLAVSASQIRAESLRRFELSGILRVFGAAQLRMSDAEAYTTVEWVLHA